jgi:hypothetical protein
VPSGCLTTPAIGPSRQPKIRRIAMTTSTPGPKCALTFSYFRPSIRLYAFATVESTGRGNMRV